MSLIAGLREVRGRSPGAGLLHQGCAVSRVEIFGKGKVQGPSQRDAQLLLEGRQFCEVDRPPKPPGEEAGHAQAENVRHAGAMPDGRELAECREAEGCFL